MSPGIKKKKKRNSIQPIHFLKCNRIERALSLKLVGEDANHNPNNFFLNIKCSLNTESIDIGYLRL